MAREGKAERPWWLTWRGVPPGWRERRNAPLSDRQVFWTRVYYAGWALFLLVAVALAVLKRLWFLPILLSPPPLQLLFWEPIHRRQLFGVRRTTA